MTFSVYHKELEELKINIKLGDYIGYWIDENEMRFKLETFRSFMKKMGYNWNEKECTRFLETGGAIPKKKFQNISSRHWVVALPKQTEHKNKDVKFVKAKAAWEDN